MASSAELRITQKIAEEIGSTLHQVVAAVGLLDEGATVPFVARYRKEVTGGLDDTQLRTLDERLSYLRELEERRAAILASIDEQGKLTPELAAQIDAAETKQSLEDLYLPYKQKRRTKAQIAREAGLAPLAEALLADPTLSPEAEAAQYLNANAAALGFADVKAVLDGARQILMERFSEDAALLGKLMAHHGIGVAFNAVRHAQPAMWRVFLSAERANISNRQQCPREPAQHQASARLAFVEFYPWCMLSCLAVACAGFGRGGGCLAGCWWLILANHAIAKDVA